MDKIVKFKELTPDDLLYEDKRVYIVIDITKDIISMSKGDERYVHDVTEHVTSSEQAMKKYCEKLLLQLEIYIVNLETKTLKCFSDNQLKHMFPDIMKYLGTLTTQNVSSYTKSCNYKYVDETEDRVYDNIADLVNTKVNYGDCNIKLFEKIE